MVQTPKRLIEQRSAIPSAARPRPRGRPFLSRFSAAHGLMVLSALLAFVLVAVITNDRREVVEVAVAREDIASGTRLAPGMFERVELPTDSGLAARLVRFAELDDGAWHGARAIAAGDPLARSDVRSGGNGSGLRSVSIPVAREHAAGGDLVVGDLVDVIDVVDGTAGFVVTAAEVADVARPGSSGGISGGSLGEFFVVVLVDA
ncbi:MAG: hypothetical protein ACRDQ7_21110, partial [Haloechinothrix sp.]